MMHTVVALTTTTTATNKRQMQKKSSHTAWESQQQEANLQLKATLAVSRYLLSQQPEGGQLASSLLISRS